jgi:phosphatidyl-myo-inositol dimannoside synthase
VTGRVVLLAPSSGLGGGIERYVEALEWAFAAQGVRYKRLDLCRPGPVAQARMLLQARRLLRDPVPTRLVVAHKTLLPVASLIARDESARGMSVVCHGCEVWGGEFRLRRHIESRLLRHRDIRVVAASSFTAGAMSRLCPATLLPPGLSGEWFQALVNGSAVGRNGRPGVHVVTAFRLAVWREKGLPELMDAVASLGRSDVYLTVCGTGVPPADLQEAVRKHAWCTLRPGLTDHQLAGELAAADLFALATRTRTGRCASGEGFGLVLLEAQVAGTAVVGPAYGGSPDTYIDGVTGVAPRDESSSALARVLDELLREPQDLEQMGRRAAEWAREAFAPERYAKLAVSRLL